MFRRLPWLVFLIQTSLLVSCAGKDPVAEIPDDLSTLEVADFEGSWDGRLNCRWVGGYTPYALVIIRNGTGKLFHVGNYGEAVSAELDPETGKILWRGKFVNYEGTGGIPYVAYGEWKNNKFEISVNRGYSLCDGLLTRKRKIAKRLKRDDVINLIAGKTELWPDGAVYYDPEGGLAAIRDGERLTGQWEVTRSGRVCTNVVGQEKHCHHYIFGEQDIETVIDAKNKGVRELIQGDAISDY